MKDKVWNERGFGNTSTVQMKKSRGSGRCSLFISLSGPSRISENLNSESQKQEESKKSHHNLKEKIQVIEKAKKKKKSRNWWRNSPCCCCCWKEKVGQENFSTFESETEMNSGEKGKEEVERWRALLRIESGGFDHSMISSFSLSSIPFPLLFPSQFYALPYCL